MKKTTFLVLSAVFFLLGFASVFLPKKQYCANSISCIKNLETEVDNTQTATFLGQEISVPKIYLSNEDISVPNQVLGVESQANLEKNDIQKHIYVDLKNQTLYAYEDNELYFQTLVSTGKWGRTPTGTFKIWIKIRAQKMSGGSGNDYYYLPNVPYIMFFYNSEVSKDRGFSLHGTYWHNNFGHAMSHGCVNLRTIDAKVLYDWTTPATTATTTRATSENPGTEITICDELEIIQGETPKCLE